MSEPQGNKLVEPTPATEDATQVTANPGELSQDELAGVSGGGFVEDLIKAIENR